MKSTKYEAANDEIALLLKEWERAVDTFCRSEIVDAKKGTTKRVIRRLGRNVLRAITSCR